MTGSIGSALASRLLRLLSLFATGSSTGSVAERFKTSSMSAIVKYSLKGTKGMMIRLRVIYIEAGGSLSLSSIGDRWTKWEDLS